ncbi:MAG: TolC family protein [Candidatus Brocadiia bacterium]
MRKFISCLIILTLNPVLMLYPQEAGSERKNSPLSLDECIRISMENNRQILLVNEAANQADAKYAEARARLFPSATITASYTRLDTVQSFEVMPGKSVEMGSLNNYKADLALKQSVYMGDRIWAGIRSGKLGQLMSSTQKDDLVRAIVFQTKRSYYDVIFNEEIVRVNLTSEDVITAHLDDVVKQNREGMASNYDVLRTQVQLSNIRTLRLQSQSNLQKSRLVLMSLMGLPLEDAANIKLTDRLVYTESMPTLFDLEENTFTNRPDLRSAQIKIDLQKEMVKIAKAEHLPTVSISGSYGEEKPSRYLVGQDKWGDYWSLTAVLSIPVYEGGRVNARVRQEKSALQQAEILQNDLKERIRLELAQAVLGLKDSLALVMSQKDNVKQAAEGLRLVEIGYKNGANTQLEVMDSQMALDTASKNYVMSLYQYNLSLANLEMVTGQIQNLKK